MADALDLAIARGPPVSTVGEQIGNLPNAYWAGLDEAYKRRTQNAFQGGVPTVNGVPGGEPDWKAINSTIIQQGGTGPALEASKVGQQQELIRGLQTMGGGVFGGPDQLPPSTGPQGAPPPPPQVTPQSIPQSAPPVARVSGGDNGQTVMGAVAPLFGDANAGRVAAAVSQRFGLDPNAPLPPEKFAQVQQFAQQVAGSRQPQQPQPQAAPPQPAPANFNDRFNQISAASREGVASVTNDPTLGGLVPKGQTAEAHLQRLRQAATLAAATGVRNAEKPYIDAIDAIQKRLQPTDEYKNYLAGKKEGETFQQWMDRKDKNAQELTVLQHSIVPRLEKSQETAIGARTDMEAIQRAREEINASKGIFSGKFAEQRLQLAKLGSLFGFPREEIANTEAFKAAVGSRVMGLVKGLGSGTSISNSDRVFAEKMAGGQIELDENSLRRIFDIGERAAKVRLQQHDTLVNGAVAANPALKQFEKVYRIEPSAAPTQAQAPAPGAKQAPDGNWYLPDPKRPGKYLMVK